MTFDPTQCVLMIQGPQGQGTCTLIAPDLVLTASHAVETNGAVDGPTGFDVFTTHAKNTAVKVSSLLCNPVQDSPSENPYAAQQDFAVVRLATPITGVGWLGYLPGWGGGVANVAGFPNSNWWQGQQTFTPDTYNTALDDTAALQPGISGSPVWTTVDGVASIAGIMTLIAGSYGYATMLTPANVNILEQWITVLKWAPAIMRLYSGLLGRYMTDADAEWYTTNLYSPAFNALAAQLGNVAPSAQAVLSANQNIVRCFTHSPEFQALATGYGTNATQFVTYLYAQALGRAPEAGAAAYYTAAIAAGATWEQVAINITQSAEAIAYAGKWGQS